MNLTTLFDLSLLARASQPALEVAEGGETRTLTFGEIELRANRMAAELARRGAKRGDRLCVQLPNGPAMIDLFLACLRLGVIFVPMNTMYRDREVRHIVTDSEPVAVVTTAASDVVIPEGVSRWTVEALLGNARELRPGRPGEYLSVDRDQPAVIVYTSGTTGVAKGAVLSHRALAANGVTLAASWDISADDRYLAVLPLFHVHGLGNGLHTWLISGCRMHLVDRFDHKTAASLFERVKPTLFFGVPTIYVRLLDPAVVSDDAATAIGRNARLFVSGSAPLPAHIHEAFRARYGHTILERYGMTEALMIASNPYDGERRAGTVGPPLPRVALRVLDDEGRDVADGNVGEVHIRSPHLFSEYWRSPDATTAAFRDGWFRTGDLGVRSPDGYLTLRGRRGDLIISGGFNIYPREIEELLLEDPRVKEVVVVGAVDPLRGEVPVAYYVADDPEVAEALAERCRSELASFKMPRSFIPVDALPRTALGKIQKHLLPAASA